MAFIPDLDAAANRHYEDACTLQSAKRFDNAGYHFGLAAECAIKKKLRDLGNVFSNVRKPASPPPPSGATNGAPPAA